MEESDSSSRRRRVLAAILCGVVILIPSGSVMGSGAEARNPDRFWQYEKPVTQHRNWWNHRWLRKRHTGWHVNHLSYTRREHRRLHRRRLRQAHRRRRHFHRVLATQVGTAAWYDRTGRTGPCGRVLKGLYAAHRTWPCGSLVSVRRGDRYVHVRVLDRGPFVPGWIIDLSPAAFKQIGPLGAGFLRVRAYRLKRLSPAGGRGRQ
jgi:rare lipoprotein A (peptidoglycan hydrolase)